MKYPICILKTSVAVKQWVRIWILCHRIVEVTEDKVIVIGVPNGVGYKQ